MLDICICGVCREVGGGFEAEVPDNATCPAAEATVLPWPAHEMKVIVIRHVAQNPHGQAFVGSGHQLRECRKVAILMEVIGPDISAIEYVAVNSADRSSSRANHVSRSMPRFPKLPLIRMSPFQLRDCDKQ